MGAARSLARSFLPAVAVRYLCASVCVCARVSIKGECARGLPKFNYPKAIKLTRNQNNKTPAPNGWIRKLSRVPHAEKERAPLPPMCIIRMTCELTQAICVSLSLSPQESLGVCFDAAAPHSHLLRRQRPKVGKAKHSAQI